VVIPIHDDNPVRRTPYVTYLLIALNFVFFFTEPVVSHLSVGQQTVAQVCDQQAYFDKYAAIPRELTRNEPLPPHNYEVQTDRGVVQCPVIDESGKQPYLSVLFAMFLHGGWLHILGNMLFLWIFGNNVEDRMGRLPFLLFYLVGGITAALAQVVIDPHSEAPLVGASGAIAAALGAYIVLFPGARILSLVFLGFFYQLLEVPALVILGFWFVLQLISGVGSLGGGTAQGGVAFFAHIGGFLLGVVVGLLLRFVGAGTMRGRPSSVSMG
jgi:membrane associated rhomboid family serine protease